MFDLSKVSTDDNFGMLDVGWYGGHIETLEWKTSAKGAEYLNAQIRLDNNRVVFCMYHVFNANDVARNSSLAAVKKALVASGFLEDKLTFATKEEMAGAMATVNCEFYLTQKKSVEYGDKNEVKNYRVRELEESTSQAIEISSDDIPF